MSGYVTAPYYYRKFRCMGSACPDTCCGGWEIRLDGETKEAYRRLCREGFDFRGAADLKNGRLVMKDGACPLLDHGLCRIHRDLGEEYLCRACRRYPRHREDYGRLQELSLSLSCPEAARLILAGSREQGKLRTWKRGRKVCGEKGWSGLQDKLNRNKGEGRGRENEGLMDRRGLTAGEEALLSELLKARELMLSLLEVDESPLMYRLAMILALAHDLQRRLGEGRIKEGLSEITGRYRLFLTPGGRRWFKARTAPFEGRLEEKYDSMAGYLGLLGSLCEVYPGFGTEVSGWMDALYRTDGGFEDYKKAVEQNRRAGGTALSEWKPYENLARYFLYLYVPGAVFDRDVCSKVKFSLFSVLCIREAALALKIGKGPEAQGERGESIRRLAALASRYSRQTEHSDENLERIESALKHSRAFSMEMLLINLLAEE